MADPSASQEFEALHLCVRVDGLGLNSGPVASAIFLIDKPSEWAVASAQMRSRSTSLTRVVAKCKRFASRFSFNICSRNSIPRSFISYFLGLSSFLDSLALFLVRLLRKPHIFGGVSLAVLMGAKQLGSIKGAQKSLGQ